MRDKRHFRDGSYNPSWPMNSDTPAAVLTVGGGYMGSTSIQLDPIRLTDNGDTWTAQADDADRTWTGTADSSIGAVLALLADRIGLHAEITFKPAPGEEQPQ